MPRFVETDEAGNTVATYVQTSSGAQGQEVRIDVILPEKPKTAAYRLLDVFLPSGYPHSVTEDYLEYQIYDSLQAFASSIAGLLSSRAVLEGVGVGDATASTTAAVLLSIVQESLGRVTTILFAHRLGTSLEPECKMYRLLADIFNDTAMILECLSPGFPKPIRVCILATSSALKALCGVAAGSSKASLSAHFARWGNLGELNAKDSSQETVISLIGMLAGGAVVSFVTTPLATWSCLILLLSAHLAMNYRAVRAVSMRTLNRQRANIVFATLIAHDKVLTPRQVSQQERVFERDGAMRDINDEVMGYCRIGVSMEELFGSLEGRHDSPRSTKVEGHLLGDLLRTFGSERVPYVLSLDSQQRQCWIVLKKGCSVSDQLQSWYAAYHAFRMVNSAGGPLDAVRTKFQQPLASQSIDDKGDLVVLERVQAMTEATFAEVVPRLQSAGWDLGTAALETRTGLRVAMDRE